MKKYFKIKSILLFLLFLTINKTKCAEYNGGNIDGYIYSCTAYSYSTGKYYYLECEFDGNEVVLYFNNGGYITLTLDDENIDDPNNISAYDYKKSIYWDLDVDL